MGRFMKHRRGKRHSIKDRLMTCAVCFIVPIILLLLVSNLYARYLLREQVAASDRNTVQLYAERIDTRLEDIKSRLVNIGGDLEVKHLGATKSYDEKILAAYQLKSQFQEDLLLYDSTVDGFFVYDLTDEIYMKETSIVGTIQQQEMIEDTIRQLVKEDQELKKPISAKWFHMHIGDKYYLIRIYHIHGGYYGSWSDVERILNEAVTIPIEGAETVLLLTKEKEPLSADQHYRDESINWEQDFSEYYLTGKDKRYMVIAEPIENGEYYFVALILDNEIQRGIHLFSILIVMMILVSIGLLWMFIRYSDEEIAIPLEHVVEVMEKVEEGNLDVVLPEESNTKEFSVLNDSFNKMLKEIKHLKIKVYEEKIQKQKAQLDFLQIQTNPHFFINAMNVLYSYARLNNMEMVKNMTLSLVKHFRYTLYGETWGFLEEEVNFIQNYLHLQELRTANTSKIQIDMDIPQTLMKEKIPIMIIQPFVENSIKYGESEEKEVKISIEVKKEKGSLKICVRDNGDGFEPDVLEALNQEQRVVREGKKRIGIQNVRSRLEILYGERAKMYFENGEDGGAIVTIWLLQETQSNDYSLEEKDERISR
ncbi:MAG: histidine kinase [Robinsoniella sp.]|nr:histidine kinase [Robinsoniella sp.]